MESREDLAEELQKMGLTKLQSITIALDAGSSQCVVDEEYLLTFDIDKETKIKVNSKVKDFYSFKGL
jgi:hypothetical protein